MPGQKWSVIFKVNEMQKLKIAWNKSKNNLINILNNNGHQLLVIRIKAVSPVKQPPPLFAVTDLLLKVLTE